MKDEIRKLEENIPKEDDISYFRDRVGRVSPGVLTFLLNKKIRYKDSIMASIFSLLQKGYIKIENGRIYPTDKTKDTLDSNEQYILDSYKFIFSFPDFRKYWEKYVVNDCIVKEYIVRNKEKYGNYILVPIGVVFFIVSFFLFDLDNVSIFIFLFLNLFFFIIDVLIYTGIGMRTNDNHKYVRTDKGQELYVKLIGLKKFLKDFSIIDERKKEELYIWEDYMIYAILFDLPGILDKEVEKEYAKLQFVEKGEI